MTVLNRHIKYPIKFIFVWKIQAIEYYKILNKKKEQGLSLRLARKLRLMTQAIEYYKILNKKKGAGTQPEACDEGLIISFLGLEQVLVSY